MNHRPASDYHAFISGAARGIGNALAAACHRAGMRVTLADLDDDRLAQPATALASTGGSTTTVRLDVTDAQSWHDAIEVAESRLGPVNLLINAAAVSAGGMAMEDIPMDQWHRVMETNVTGTFLGIKTLVPLLKARQQPAHIVNVASGAGLVATPNLGVFHASKYAVVGLSEALRLELAPHDIGVTVVCPGPARVQPKAGADHASPEGEAVRQSFRAREVSPEVVASQTLAAIFDNDPYVVTHPELLHAVKSRFKMILESFARSDGERSS